MNSAEIGESRYQLLLARPLQGWDTSSTAPDGHGSTHFMHPEHL